jgi:hypothetical protein
MVIAFKIIKVNVINRFTSSQHQRGNLGTSHSLKMNEIFENEENSCTNATYQPKFNFEH